MLDTVETETYIYIATERVTPLEWHACRKSLSEETSKWGLYTVSNALTFINDEASAVHGNLRLGSIFTSQSGEWRLGGFDVLSSMKEDDPIIYRYGTSLPKANIYAPPEVAKSGWESIKRYPLSATDAWGFGILVYEVFNGCYIDSDQIGLTKSIPPSMHQNYKRLFNTNPRARLTVPNFRDQGRRSSGFFTTPLIRISEGIESLDLKSDAEREEFLSELNEVTDDFPEEFFSVKILPELLKSVEFGGGGPKVFAAIMKIGSRLSDEEWDTKLTPVIVRLFSNPDRAIRVCLLDNLSNMIEHLPQKLVNDKIFPQMATGFTDTAPLVREQTVKAVLTIIAKLTDRTINGELLKQLAKTSNDEQPGIRTNTTICMGKIARHLGQNTRQKVLVAAFSRSLRDPFVHARNAALLALVATSDLFSEEDCASKILPALCPSLVDKERLVRDQANKSFDIYIQKIRKYATTLPDTTLPQSTAVTNGMAPRMITSQNDSAGWTGWAISSFTNKLGTASGAMQTKAPSALYTPPSNQPSSLVLPGDNTSGSLPTSASASTLHRQAVNRTTSPAPTPPEQLFQDPQADDEEINEAWGELAEDSFFDAPSSQTKSPPASFDDGGEPDFEGWLKAQAQSKSKSKAPLPKGLSRPSKQRNARTTVPRTATTGSVGSGTGPKKLATTAARPKIGTREVIDTNQAEADDEWGDAWD